MRKSSKIKDIISVVGWKSILIMLLFPFLGEFLERIFLFDQKTFEHTGTFIELTFEMLIIVFIIIFIYRKCIAGQELREELLIEKNKLDSLVKAMNVGMTVRDREYNVIYENAIVENLFGDQRGRKCYVAFAGLEEICEGCPVEKTFSDGKSYTLDKVAVTKAGDVTYWENTSYPLFSTNGEITSCLEVNRNVTEKKKIEEEFRKSEERLRALFNAAPNAVYECDVNGAYTMVNPSFSRITGYSREELLKMHIWDMVEPGEKKDSLPEYIRYLINKQPEPAPYYNRALRKDGTVIDVQVDWTYMRDKDGGVTGFVCILADITDRIKAEMDLVKAKEAAEAANIAKNQFLANISHEIRTPMNGIIGMTDILLDTKLTDSQHEYLRIIQLATDQLMSVINSILDFSKIESGRLSLDNEYFNLRENIEYIREALLIQANEKNLGLAIKFAPELPELIMGDVIRLKQILMNIINNAIKFTEKGNIVLSIEKESQTSEYVDLHFMVSDTGIGIPEDKQNVIFDPFLQIDGSLTRSHGGTGLGLSICKQLVEMMNGRIWVESEVGKGSTFHFTARFDLGKFSNGNNNESEIGVSLAAGTQKPLNILVAEDSDISRELLTINLKKHGHRITIAKNGLEVLELVKKENFDIVLMDVQMPLMSGFDTTAAIRDKERGTGGHIPIIAMTAHALKEDEELCLKNGMDAYISKPIKLEKLLEIISRLTQEDKQTA